MLNNQILRLMGLGLILVTSAACAPAPTVSPAPNPQPIAPLATEASRRPGWRASL